MQCEAKQRITHRDRLHDIPAKVGQKGQAIDNVPPRTHDDKATGSDPLGAAVSDSVAFALDLCQTGDFLADLAETHAQIVAPVVECRDYHTDALRRALDLNHEFLHRRSVADEVSNLSAAGPPYKFIVL